MMGKVSAGRGERGHGKGAGLPVGDGGEEGVDHAEPELRVPTRLPHLAPFPLDDDVAAGFVSQDAGSSAHPTRQYSKSSFSFHTLKVNSRHPLLLRLQPPYLLRTAQQE